MKKKIIEILEKYHCKLYEGHCDDDTVYGIDDNDHKKIANDLVKLLNIPIVRLSLKDIGKAASEALEITKLPPNPKTTKRELELGRRAYMNGAIWAKNKYERNEA